VTDEDRDRGARRRRDGAAALSNQVFVRLMVAATVTFVVIFAAAYVYLAPLGQRTVRSVVPVVDAFMRAGSTGDSTRALLFLSSDALRTRQTGMDQVLDQPELFAGYSGLVTRSFRVLPPTETGGVDMAILRATVRYVSAPPAQLDAVLVLENDTWRINDLRITPLAPPP
jgi:hypothetical protein